jgi:hypothetical protein
MPSLGEKIYTRPKRRGKTAVRLRRGDATDGEK